MAAASQRCWPPKGRVSPCPDASRTWSRPRSTYGAPDILVINSPGSVPDPVTNRWRGFDNCSDDDFLEIYQSFVMSTVYLAREVLPDMRRRGWGRLVNIGSIAMMTPHLEDPMPATNIRVAVAALIKTLSQENGPFGITANTVATGPFDGELSRDYRIGHRHQDRRVVRQDAAGRSVGPAGGDGIPRVLPLLVEGGVRHRRDDPDRRRLHEEPLLPSAPPTTSDVGMTSTGRIPTMRVTEKGQVTIPKDLRDALGIGAGTEVEFERRRDTIVVRKAKTSAVRGRRLADRLRGRGDVDMTTDEIMALTRAD